MSSTERLPQTSKALQQIQLALEIKKLCFCYPNEPNVLDEISLLVKAGERIGVIGHNGCGKTTFFRLICGVLKPNAGEVVVFGEPILPGDFRPEIGLLFQDPDDQLFSASVREDVAFGPQNMGLPPEEVDLRVQEAIALTGLQTLSHRPPHHLSGGEKQMVAIAGVLAMRPRVMLYDEPSANLDLRARRRLIQFLQRSQETLLISAHDLELILEVCDRVILMDEGRIVADGDPHQIMGNQELMERHGLEKPHSLIPHVDPHHG